MAVKAHHRRVQLVDIQLAVDEPIEEGQAAVVQTMTDFGVDAEHLFNRILPNRALFVVDKRESGCATWCSLW